MKKSIFILAVAAVAIFSCKKKTEPMPEPAPAPIVDETPVYEIPTTYNFTNVSYTGQTQRLSMLDELSVYMKTANNSGTVVEATKMKEMYANTNNRFADNSLNTSGKQIKDKVFSLDQALFEKFMDSLATSSTSTVAGTNGTAGVLVSNDGSKKYLVDERGYEHIQTIEKGIMGALLYYQIVEVYLGDGKIGDNVDNITVTEGLGTPMEHHWDEAFGYLGVPKDFPTNKSGIKYWAKYMDARDAKLGSNKKIMDAFLKGRAAISNKDMKTKNEQVKIIKEEIEKMIAATAINYINSAKANFSDDALRNHALSECVAFIRGLKYSSARKITQAQIDEAVGYVGNNLYNVTTTNLDKARDLISNIYGFNDIKTTL
jgi:hypothetical protein